MPVDDPQVDEVENDVIDDTEQEVVNEVVEDAAPTQGELPLGDTPESSATVNEQETQAWKEILGQAGFTDFDSMDSAAERFVESHQLQQSRIDDLAGRIKFYEQQLSSQGAAPQQAQPQQVSPGPVDASPESESSQLSQMLSGWKEIPTQLINQYWTEDNQISPEAPPEVRAELLQAQQRQLNWGTVLQDPSKLIPMLEEHFSGKFKNSFESEYEQRQRAMEEDAALQRFEDDNAGWLYEKDPATGNFIVDPINQQAVLSNKGQSFVECLRHVDSSWQITSNAARYEAALNLYQNRERSVAERPVEARQQASEVNVQRKREMRGRRNTAPQTQASINGVSPSSGAGETGERQQSIGEEFFSTLETA